MNFHRQFSTFVACGLFGMLGSAAFVTDAISAPAQMLNKTVRYTYSASAQAMRADGKSVVASENGQSTLYISSQGRIFHRSDVKQYAQTGQKHRGPDEGHFKIVGNQLVGVAQHASGATRITVSFDPDFRTCTV